MTDIYVRRFNSAPRGRRWFPWIIILILAGVAAGWWFMRSREAVSADPGPAPAAPASTEEGSAAPEPAEPSAAKSAPEKSGRETPPSPSPAVEAPDPAAMEVFREAMELVRGNRLRAARDKLYGLLERDLAERLASSTKNLLGQVNSALAFSPRDMREKSEYIVKSGDNLWELARRFDTTVAYLQESNDLENDALRPGMRLRYLDGTFRVDVDKSRFILDLYLNERFFKRYRVAIGKHDRTPEGTFKVGDPVVHPDWYSPDGLIPYGHPDNILGTHWLPLISKDRPELKGYGIHGTRDPASIGSEASAGCVRMMNKDIREVYMLVTRGTPVVIHE
ncbi:L,D-transpeptidase family protein [Kiritimatiella glycovorans]|uniref:L,D-transpeptidase YkuD n=1 Tax=Kiritimatiella glycovorans TaxID=1307763 RepID=A0A0G3ECQ6_9BACT|nr:L,D-transpeptidase family protein [Kiritimatiella glycovorans]AKJ64286.1 Putative L,D-transpeptidase YkuD [Kiritimatiella glycovorans]